MTTRLDPLKLRPRTQLTVLLDQLDLTATPNELRTVREAWQSGDSVGDMAERLQRDPDEVALMIMHMARQLRIGPRPGGAYGTAFRDTEPN